MCFIFASFGFHNSSYDLGSKGPAVKSVFVCLYKRRLLGYGRRFTIEARNHFVSPVYLRWEISSWQICSTVVSQVYSVHLMRLLHSRLRMELERALVMSVALLSPELVPAQMVSENVNLSGAVARSVAAAGVFG